MNVLSGVFYVLFPPIIDSDFNILQACHTKMNTINISPSHKIILEIAGKYVP